MASQVLRAVVREKVLGKAGRDTVPSELFEPVPDSWDDVDYDVIVVGAGPTGLACANAVAMNGGTCLVVDQRDGISEKDSKCTGIRPRTLEILRHVGVSDLTPCPVTDLPVFLCTASAGPSGLLHSLRPGEDPDPVYGSPPHRPPVAASLEQWKVEKALLAALGGEGKGGRARCAFEARLQGFEAAEGGVTAHFASRAPPPQRAAAAAGAAASGKAGNTAAEWEVLPKPSTSAPAAAKGRGAAAAAAAAGGGDGGAGGRPGSGGAWELVGRAEWRHAFSLRCKFLVGADGASSPVRSALGVPRAGAPYPERFLIADALLSGFTFDLTSRPTFLHAEPEPEARRRFATRDFHAAPLGGGKFRLFFTVDPEAGCTEALEAFEALQTAMAAAQAGCAQQQQGGLEAAREWVQGRIEEYGLRWRVDEVLRVSKYSIFLGYALSARGPRSPAPPPPAAAAESAGASGRSADEGGAGAGAGPGAWRVFLAGDAAHSHSPHGGQGANAGVQDGYALGWRLALACDPALRPAEALLESYAAERAPVWRNLIRFADALKRLAGTAHPSPADRAARALFWALPPALRRRLVLDRLANKSYAYAASPLAAWGGACGGGEGAAEPGRQPPNSWVALHAPGGAQPQQTTLYDAITAPGSGGFSLLFFARGGPATGRGASRRASWWARPPFAVAAAAVAARLVGGGALKPAAAAFAAAAGFLLKRLLWGGGGGGAGGGLESAGAAARAEEEDGALARSLFQLARQHPALQGRCKTFVVLQEGRPLPAWWAAAAAAKGSSGGDAASSAPAVLVDVDARLARAFGAAGARSPVAALVRPDCHVAWCGRAAALGEAQQQWGALARYLRVVSSGAAVTTPAAAAAAGAAT